MEKTEKTESLIRIMVRTGYDLQKLRVSTGNRIAAAFRGRLDIPPSSREEDADEQAKKILEVLRLSYRRIADAISADGKRLTKGNFAGDETIRSRSEFDLVEQYMSLLGREQEHFKSLKGFLGEYPIYTQFLEGVKGCGPAMAGVIISELDPRVAEYPSSFWKYSGLDVVRVVDEATGEEKYEGRSRRKQHLREIQYTDRDGQPAVRNGLTFSPFLKTKLVGVLATSFLRSKGPYAEVYYDYKHRLENDPRHKDKSKGHRHAMCLRYMIKRFLVDLHREWRRLEGLPVSEEYSVAKLGMVHGKAKEA